MRLPLPLRHLTTRALLVLVLLPALALAKQPIQSPADDNQYRYLTLDNDLRVLLVSDASADKAAASLNVAVGSGDNPPEREGLAHFLEHMLFLGTEKYPDPGEYQQFIRRHGGSHNAFTAFQDTNYFFDIQPRFLEPALDRFAQQFSAPLFTPELVDRERSAVHSEFSASRKDDSRRYYSVRRAIANPEHAFSQFSVGNLTTLANTDERPLRKDLVEFWQSHYSANLMTLAVYGPQSLDELEQMVRQRFSKIENRHLNAKVYRQPLFVEEQLPARLQVQTLRDIRRLQLIFPIPSQQSRYQTKPLGYVAGLLGHEGPGSLLDVLKDRGWVEKLSAGSGTDTGQHASLELTLALTEEGLKHQDEIIALTFDYIELIRQQGIDRFRFEEDQQLAELDFRYQARPDPVHYVTRLSMQMRKVAPEDVLRAPWMMTEYTPDQYRELLDYLTRDNLLIALQSSQDLPEDSASTPWYKTHYHFEPNIAVPDTSERVVSLSERLALPGPNPFIPEALDILDGPSMEQPEQLARFGNLAVWHAQDTRFDRPEANIFLSLRSPLVSETPRGRVLAQLLAELVSVELNPWAYPAQIAGLDYRVYSHLRGITLRAGGFNDRLPVLMSRIVRTLAHPELSEQRFEIARQQLIDSLRNSLKDRPVSRAAALVQDALIEGAWTTEERLAVAQELTIDDLRRFAADLTREADAVMMVHGNVTAAFALNTAQEARALLLHNSQQANVPRSRVRDLPDGETDTILNVDHPDTGYLRYSQGQDTSFQQRARYRLLSQVISGPFYEDIRTTRQLGYVVYATPFEMLETPAIGFVVQSPKADAQTIDQAVGEFARSFRPTIENLTAAELEQEKRAVISKLMEQDRTLSDVSGRYWQDIDRGATEFDTRDKLVEAIRHVSRQELLAAFDAALLDGDSTMLVTTSAAQASTDAVLDTLRRQPPVAN